MPSRHRANNARKNVKNAHSLRVPSKHVDVPFIELIWPFVPALALCIQKKKKFGLRIQFPISIFDVPWLERSLVVSGVFRAWKGFVYFHFWEVSISMLLFSVLFILESWWWNRNGNMVGRYLKIRQCGMFINLQNSWYTKTKKNTL